MNQAVAEMIVTIGTMCGWCIWLVTVWFFRKMSRRDAVITRQVPVEAQSLNDLRKNILRILAGQPQWRVLERADTVIKAIAMRAVMTITLSQAQSVTNCQIALDFRRIDRPFVLWMRLALFALAPLALLGIPELLRRFVVASPIPGVQWQAVQIVQIVHILWPPFVMYAMHTQIRAFIISLVDHMALMLDIGP